MSGAVIVDSPLHTKRFLF